MNGRTQCLLAGKLAVNAIVFVGILVAGSACGLWARYANPPATLQAADLAGAWRVQYSKGTFDQFVLRADGTFQQHYENRPEDYTYETSWNPWSLERYPDGRVRLVLQGAHYYPAGISWGKREGFDDIDPRTPASSQVGTSPIVYFDPIANELVRMPHLIILNVQTDDSGNLVLIQMLMGVEGKDVVSAAKLRRVEGR